MLAIIATDGALTFTDETTDYDAVRAALGGTPALVPGSLDPGTAVWVDDDGMSRGLERNILGTLFASMLARGRTDLLLFGPVVVTGVRNEPEEGVLPDDLDPDRVAAVQEIIGQMETTLAGVQPDGMPPWVYDGLRAEADALRERPMPMTTVTIVDEAELDAWLGR